MYTHSPPYQCTHTVRPTNVHTQSTLPMYTHSPSYQCTHTQSTLPRYTDTQSTLPMYTHSPPKHGTYTRTSLRFQPNVGLHTWCPLGTCIRTCKHMYHSTQTHQDVRTGGHVVYNPVEVACKASEGLVSGQNGVQESEPNDNEGIGPQLTNRAFWGCILQPCKKKLNLMQPWKVTCVPSIISSILTLRSSKGTI